MSTEKRFALFLVLSFGLMWALPHLHSWLGWAPPPKAKSRPAASVAKAKAKAPESEKKEEGTEPAATPEPDSVSAPDQPNTETEPPKPEVAQEPEPPLVPSNQLVLGAGPDGKPAEGYQLVVRLDQRGAGVASLTTRYEAEQVDRGTPAGLLDLIQSDPLAYPSLTMGFDDPKRVSDPDVEIPLDLRPWEVELNPAGGPVHDLKGGGQEVRFRAKVGDPLVQVTKRYQLRPGRDAFDLILEFAHPGGGEGSRRIGYKLTGPHGIPIEGAWYTSTFREVFLGQMDEGHLKIVSRPASTIAGAKEPERFTESPIRFAGVENQYFAVMVCPGKETPGLNWIAEATTQLVHKDIKEPQKSDVSVDLISQPIEVAPNQSVVQHYQVFAGAKTETTLAPFTAFGAEGLATYRKGWNLPLIRDLGASFLSQHFIKPMLGGTYGLTQWVARQFGGERGSYGIAIILLTITVRLIMFPLSRKQAISAKKMQDLQPLMAELKEKYKDDKEEMTRQTFALYKQYGVNPMGGCLPALIQLPIFIGLWQTLNNSVDLRHAQFLWIRNLAAPDMLVDLHFDLPFHLGHYLNLLPFVVVVLMLVQMKLFSPPPTTPEAEMQQQMMKFMMVFMAFMFYKVPSGLGLYFITSSLWAIGERKLLPRITPSSALKKVDDEKPGRTTSESGKGKPAGDGSARGGWLSQKLEALLDEASKDRTVRNERDRDSDKARDRDRPRDKPRPRPGGGGKRR